MAVEDRRVERESMVERQLAGRGVRDPRVLQAMRGVPRELFVPPGQRAGAYDDRPLPIGEGQTISQPFMVAVMTAALAPGATDRVLEIGTGSGYQTAVLAQLAAEVVTIERHASLAASARAALDAVGAPHVTILVGDGSAGVPDRAPYDRILVTAGAPAVPATLRDQLADGGRLVIPVGPPELQWLTVVSRHGDRFEEARLEPCAFVPLVGEHGWPSA